MTPKSKEMDPFLERAKRVLREEGLAGALRKTSLRINAEIIRGKLVFLGRGGPRLIENKKDEPIDPSEINRIMVVSIRGIGDAILATPAMQMIKSNFQNAEITLFASGSAHKILAGAPVIDREILIPSGSLEFTHPGFYKALYEAKDFGPQIIFIFYPTLFRPLSEMAPRLMADKIFAADHESVVPVTKTISVDESPHVAEINANLARLAGCREDTPLPEIWLKEEEEEAAEKWLSAKDINSPLVVIHSGGTPGLRKYKTWPAEKTAKLISSIQKNGAGVVLLKGPDEKDIVEKISRKLSEPCIIAGEELSLRETAALVKKADLLVANDSSWVNVATAVRTRVIALFGPVNEKSHPFGQKGKVHVITSPAECAPCHTLGSRLQCDVPHCMEDISFETVFDKVMDVIRSFPGQNK